MMVLEDNKISDKKFKATKNEADDLINILIAGGTRTNTIKDKIIKN